FYILSRRTVSNLRTLVQDAEQVVEVIAVVLFLRRGILDRLHADARIERLGEDGVGDRGLDRRLHGGRLRLFDGRRFRRNALLGRARALGVDMRLDGLVDFRRALEAGGDNGDAHLVAQALVKRSTPDDV